MDDIGQFVRFQDGFKGSVEVFEADVAWLLHDVAPTSEYVFDEVLWALYSSNEVGFTARRHHK